MAGGDGGCGGGGVGAAAAAAAGDHGRPLLDDDSLREVDSFGKSNSLNRRTSPRQTWMVPAHSMQDLENFSLNPQLGVLAVVAMTFFNVSGGPWGSEDIFSLSSPYTGSLGIVVFSVFFCIPQILVTAELSCALRSNGGYSVWVREAFGDFWGFQVTYWQFVSGVADAAVYPVLITDSVLQLLGRSDVAAIEIWFWRVLTTALLSLPTFVSIRSVPNLLIVLAFITGLPVVAFILVGMTRVRPAVWFESRHGKPVGFGKLVNVLFWNLEGWDCISTCSALCADPIEETVPRGLFAALGLTSVQYLLVLLVAAGISQDTYPWQAWNDGTLPSIGCSLGKWMVGLLMTASVVGNAGQYLSEFMEQSYLLQGAAEIGIVPSFLGKVLPSGAPFVANFAQLVIILCLLAFDFGDILTFDNFFCATAMILEFAAFFTLRWRRPDLARPFRTPRALVPLFLPASAVLLIVWCHCLAKSWLSLLINLVAFALGVPYGLWIARRSEKEHREGHRSALDHFLEDD